MIVWNLVRHIIVLNSIKCLVEVIDISDFKLFVRVWGYFLAVILQLTH